MISKLVPVTFNTLSSAVNSNVAFAFFSASAIVPTTALTPQTIANVLASSGVFTAKKISAPARPGASIFRGLDAPHQSTMAS